MSYFLRKKWMVNLSGAGKILWALNMKKDSYPYLICMTVLGLYFPFLLVAGRYLQGHVS
ncbi:putative transmembrane protein [Escherichia coli PA48]|nr:putative transmembrane protein [Escherichia coli EC96038]EKK77405.1 putative transmembrane protein [Escherichia coli 10.0869]ELW05224.1 putative transmembrane protein [Escherichia coli PA48]